MKTVNAPEDTTSTTCKSFAVLFDMDGVLVDVTGSYRRAIQKTVQFFTGETVQPREIQELKERGGYNNDWDLTEAILISKGQKAPKKEIIQKFQEFYLGAEGESGLIENEKWLLRKEKIEELRKKHCLGIVTGRPREETVYVLRKFDVESLFDVVVAMEDYPPEKSKPDAYPITLALKKLGVQDAVYVGDSVDDIKAAVRAGVKAIGCVPPDVSAGELKELLYSMGAEKVLSNVNQVNDVLP
ncbi:MAG: TIGR01548 family HAD-type hydrolase [Candidatus Bathyarchaeota archaeon]|nr:TIGR01548 family HAD-type hydrolase [Candidatus Bathyarchaeota archaeon]